MIAHAKPCAPEWYHSGLQCPYGTTPLSDWGIDPLEVSSWTWPYQHDPLPLYLVAGFYSCMEIVVAYGPIFFIFGLSTSSLVFFLAYWGWKMPITKILKYTIFQ